MSRPLRIEYSGAIYHVMNRGRGRSTIFCGKRCIELFIQGLKEAHQRFGLEILAYCLMGNHYHLLVRTPRGNLGRCMRHINGLYTQRYNQLLKTDGPLFRGRYKAILVDAENYLLQVSRYIHRNPIETKKPLVEKLEDYYFSSYRYYIGLGTSPKWLNRKLVLFMISQEKYYVNYKAYVEAGISVKLKEFYRNDSNKLILGDSVFVKRVNKWLSQKKGLDNEITGFKKLDTLAMDVIIAKVSNYYRIESKQIVIAARGAGKKNIARRVAMYLCQLYSDVTLKQLADKFNVSHYSTVIQTIKRLLNDIEHDVILKEEVNVLCQDLTP